MTGAILTSYCNWEHSLPRVTPDSRSGIQAFVQFDPVIDAVSCMSSTKPLLVDPLMIRNVARSYDHVTRNQEKRFAFVSWVFSKLARIANARVITSAGGGDRNPLLY